MNDRTEHDAEATQGENGQFDVLADGSLIFSKKREGRFPDEDEIISAIT